jgi:FkbM family methyltransferase
MKPYEMFHHAVSAVTRRLGITIRRNYPATHDTMALVAMLQKRNVDLVLDVGANRGQFAEELFHMGYTGAIVSYEPLAAPRKVLMAKRGKYPKWTIADACCLGDQPGEVDVQVSMNEVASSILNTTSTMASYDKNFHYVRSERVPIYRLDDIAPEARFPFLKIDVQGFEEAVLRGAPETLKKCVGLSIEISFVELYEGQKLFREMIDWLDDMGFIPHRMAVSYTDVTDGRWLQADVVCFRPDDKRTSGVG